MRQAIQTKYLCPTDHRGARVKATADAGSVTVAWDYAKDPKENHIAACIVLVEKLGWKGDWYGGGTSNGYVFVDCNASSLAFEVNQ